MLGVSISITRVRPTFDMFGRGLGVSVSCVYSYAYNQVVMCVRSQCMSAHHKFHMRSEHLILGACLLENGYSSGKVGVTVIIPEQPTKRQCHMHQVLDRAVVYHSSKPDFPNETSV